MPDQLTTTSTLTNLIQTSYDKLVEFNLRSEPMFRKLADKRPADVTNPGSTVTFQFHRDLAKKTTTLNEAQDVDAVAISNTDKVSVTLNEYGNAVISSERVALETLSAIDPAIAEMVAFNMRDSLDALVYNILTSPATGRFTGTTAADELEVNGEDISGGTSGAEFLKARDILKAVAKLRGASVEPRDGGFYLAMVHPDVSFDFRTESAANGNYTWREPHTYTDTSVGNNWTGEIGVFGSVKFIESPRVAYEVDGTDVTYKTLILGKQALLEAVTREPGTVVGPVTDRLMRFRPVGWKGLLGWNIYRPEARYVITSQSSIAPTIEAPVEDED